MNQNSNFLQDILLTLAKAEVDFVVCGGVAIVLHGVNRFTADVDIALDMSKDNVHKFLDCMKVLQMNPRVPVPPEHFLDESKRALWMKEKGAVVFTFLDYNNPFRQVDVFLKPIIPYNQLKNTAVDFLIDNQKIFIASIDDLLVMKSQVTPLRKKDEDDIAALQDLKGKIFRG